MKKILITLLLMFVSISGFSQKIISNFSIGYDKNAEMYCSVRITNYSYNKTIVCVLIQLQFEKKVWDKYTQRPVYPLILYKLTDANIKPRNYRENQFYPDQIYWKQTKVILKKIIYSDGSFKDF